MLYFNSIFASEANFQLMPVQTVTEICRSQRAMCFRITQTLWIRFTYPCAIYIRTSYIILCGKI